MGMAVYNGERYIADAVESIRSERYPNWELLAVNDCSTDSSVEILESFNDPRIRVLSNEHNLGLVGVRNRIMREARGTYVAWLDQDDLTYPNRMLQQVAYLESHPECDVCGSWTATRVEHSDGTTEATVERMPGGHDEIRAAMLFLNPIACNTVTMRRSSFGQAALEFRPAFGNSLDYDLWSNASDTMRLHNLPEVLGAYRVHDSQTSRGAALEKMNAHAMQIQVDLAGRALGIDMDADERRWHRLATIAPVEVTDPTDLDHVANWFGKLRRANEDRKAFNRREFDQALARQWTTVVLAAFQSGGSKAAVASRAVQGVGVIGVPVSAMAASMTAGVRRRLARSSTRI